MDSVKQEEGPLSYGCSLGKLQEKTETSLHRKRKSSQRKEHFTGAWTRVEQIAYFRFVLESYEIMNNSKLRKRYRIFKRMSEIIGTRGTIQCKSHHQKMMISHHNDFQRLLAYGKNAYLSESALSLVGELEKADSCFASKNFFYRIYAKGSCIKIVINEEYIESYS